MKYIYFVPYSYRNDEGAGTGNCSIDLNKAITSYEQINEITAKMQAAFHMEIAITNYILLRTEEAE